MPWARARAAAACVNLLNLAPPSPSHRHALGAGWSRPGASFAGIAGVQGGVQGVSPDVSRGQLRHPRHRGCYPLMQPYPTVDAKCICTVRGLLVVGDFFIIIKPNIAWPRSRRFTGRDPMATSSFLASRLVSTPSLRSSCRCQLYRTVQIHSI